jgi:hypothetical protein
MFAFALGFLVCAAHGSINLCSHRRGGAIVIQHPFSHAHSPRLCHTLVHRLAFMSMRYWCREVQGRVFLTPLFRTSVGCGCVACGRHELARSGVGNVPITPSTRTSTAWVLGGVHYRYSRLLTCVGHHRCALGLSSLRTAF